MVGKPQHRIRRVNRTRVDGGQLYGVFAIYAELRQMDQRVIHSANCGDEFETIVCMDGSLPNSAQLQIRTRGTLAQVGPKVPRDD